RPSSVRRERLGAGERSLMVSSCAPLYQGAAKARAVSRRVRPYSSRPGGRPPPPPMRQNTAEWEPRRLLSNSFGDAGLLRRIRIYQPDVVLTRYIHQSAFRPGSSWVDQVGSTWVFRSEERRVGKE